MERDGNVVAISSADIGNKWQKLGTARCDVSLKILSLRALDSERSQRMVIIGGDGQMWTDNVLYLRSAPAFTRFCQTATRSDERSGQVVALHPNHDGRSNKGGAEQQPEVTIGSESLETFDPS